MRIYVILAWDAGEQYPEGRAFVNEELAGRHCEGSDGWLTYVEVDLDTTTEVKR